MSKSENSSSVAARVLVACEFSGVLREAFRARGVDAVSCDLLPTEIPGPHIQDDVLKHLDEGWWGMVAHPPCTYLAVSGNRWMHEGGFFERRERKAKMEAAVEFVKKLWAAPIPRVAIENPVSRLSTLWRKTNQVVQPWQLGSPLLKKTCFWIRGFPLLHHVPTLATPEPRVWREPPSAERWKNRSRTPPEMAAQIAEQWQPLKVIQQ